MLRPGGRVFILWPGLPGVGAEMGTVMPLYEYVCQGCKHEFEELVRMDDRDGKVACPKCGGGKTARQMSVFAPGQSSKPSIPPPAAGCQGCCQQGSCSAGGF